MFSQAEENYLKAIYALEEKLKKNISTNILAVLFPRFVYKNLSLIRESLDNERPV